MNMTEEVLRECGASFCPYSYLNNTNLDRPSLPKVVNIVSIIVLKCFEIHLLGACQ